MRNTALFVAQNVALLFAIYAVSFMLMPYVRYMEY